MLLLTDDGTAVRRAKGIVAGAGAAIELGHVDAFDDFRPVGHDDGGWNCARRGEGIAGELRFDDDGVLRDLLRFGFSDGRWRSFDKERESHLRQRRRIEKRNEDECEED